MTGTNSRWTTRLLELSMVVVSILVSSILFDKGLALLKFPSSPLRVANPPHFTEARANIEFHYNFSTNSQGLRYKEIPLEKPPGTHRVFVVGDSFTEGTGVEINETFSSLLEQSFAKDGHAAEFINAGLAGTGPDQYARVFFGVGLGYQPDGLLICVYQNDVSNMPEALSPAELHPELFAPASGVKRLAYRLYPRTYSLLYRLRAAAAAPRTDTPDLIAAISERAGQTGVPADRIARWKASLPPHLVQAANSGMFNGAVLSYGLLRPYYYTDALDIDTPRAEKKWQSMVIALNEMVRGARQRNIAVGVLYFPAPHQYDPSVYGPDNVQRLTGMVLREDWLTVEAEVEKRLAAWSSGEHVAFLDLTPKFRQARKQGPNLNWALDGHWNQQGHRVAAQAIHDWIQQGGALDFLH